jgi:hypothetical protein
VEAVQIRFESVCLPSYFLQPGVDPATRKTVMVLAGFDGSGEELPLSSPSVSLRPSTNL